MRAAFARPTVLAVLVAALTVPLAASGPASAQGQPCTMSYSAAGGDIRPGPDPGKDHSLNWLNLEIAEERAVVDLGLSVDLAHPRAQDLKINLLGPQTQPSLLPNVVALDKGQISGPVDAAYAFDDEAAAKVAGSSPAGGVYQPATPLTALEVPPFTGNWSLWVSNYGTAAGSVRSWSITLTFATCDTDGDGVEESVDRCPLASDPEQVDRDGDGRGDACDDDLDGDGVVNVVDDCAEVTSSTSSGCPAAERRAKMRHVRKKHDLRVKVRSYYAECQAGARVTLWRVKKGRDARVKRFTTDKRGAKTLGAPRRPGRYYVRVKAFYAEGVAECPSVKSERVRVRGRRAR